MNNIVNTENIKYEYAKHDNEGNVVDTVHALDGVSINVEAGSFIAVLGGNGSGKSTFAKHLNALLVPSEGTVYIDKMNTTDDSLKFDIRKTAGMVTLMSFAVTIYFGHWIKAVLPVNLLLLLLFVQAIYAAIRWYVKGWREARGYC